MDSHVILIFLALLFGFYVAWNIGANDVANAVGTAVGSGSLTLKQAVLIAAIFEFCGAFFLGSNVSETVAGGIVNPALFTNDTLDYVLGMLASLLAVGVWMQIASYFGWPVSTTHSIVGAVLGFGLIIGGLNAIFWGKIGSIAASWIISPFLGGVLAYFIFMIIRRRILYRRNPIVAAKKLTPYLIFAVFFVLSLIIFFGGLNNLNFELSFWQAISIAFVIGLVAALISAPLVRRIKEQMLKDDGQNIQVANSLRKVQRHLKRAEAAALGDAQTKVHELLEEVHDLSKTIKVREDLIAKSSEYRDVERIFIYFQIITACFLAFAHGSNDVANAIGPLSAIFNALQGRPIAAMQTVSTWLLVLGGVGIIIGLASWGWRVIETVGRKITELTPSRGFAACFGSSITIILASKLGLPISTTHVLVGAVLGIGFARGLGAINLNIVRDIAISWVITLPAGASLAIVFFYILNAIFN